MIKYLLNCKNCSLEFESWFASSKEFDKLKSIDGVKFNPILNKWKLSNDKSVNYITKYK